MNMELIRKILATINGVSLIQTDPFCFELKNHIFTISPCTGLVDTYRVTMTIIAEECLGYESAKNYLAAYMLTYKRYSS